MRPDLKMFYYGKKIIKSKIWFFGWVTFAALLCSVLINTANAQSFRGSKSLLAWQVSMDYSLRIGEITIKNKTTNQAIKMTPLNHVFKVKVGGKLAKYNFFYLSTAFIEASGKDKKISRFNNSSPNLKLDYSTFGYSMGLGYALVLGSQKKDSFNFYAGLEVGFLLYLNSYYTNEPLSNKIFKNETTSLSVLPNIEFSIGLNYLVGAVDYHIEFLYFLSPGPETKLKMNSADRYVDKSNLSGPSFAIGISTYF